MREPFRMSRPHAGLVAAFTRVRRLHSCAGWLERELKDAGLYELALARRQEERAKRDGERPPKLHIPRGRR